MHVILLHIGGKPLDVCNLLLLADLKPLRSVRKVPGNVVLPYTINLNAFHASQARMQTGNTAQSALYLRPLPAFLTYRKWSVH